MLYWSDLGLTGFSTVYTHFSFESREGLREAAPSECLNFFFSLTLRLDRRNEVWWGWVGGTWADGDIVGFCFVFFASEPDPGASRLPQLRGIC